MVIINKHLPPEIVARLGEFADNIICAPEAATLPKGLKAHPDMLMHLSPQGLICAPEICAELNSLGVPAQGGSADPGEKYPLDIRYNCFHIGGALICNRRHTDRAITEIYEKRGMPIYDCRQGYASCSTLRMPGAVITADTGIASACEKAGADVLLISPGGIRLDGYDYGFIGGCGGYVAGRLLFFGDVRTHPDGERIAEFCRIRGVEIVALSGGTLTDYGGMTELKAEGTTV